MLVEKLASIFYPCFSCDAQKRPLIQDWPNQATTDANKRARMFALPRAELIGVVTGQKSGIVVIDIDVKNGGQGMTWYQANAHQIPQTLTHRTASGGIHLVFQVAPELIRNSASKIAPNVDVRGEAGYVVWPPSPGYEVIDASPPAVMPDWLVHACIAAPPMAALHPDAAPWRVKRQVIDANGTPYGRAALDAACSEIRHAPDGAKHSIIVRQAYSIGGLVPHELPEAYARSMLEAALADMIGRGTTKDQRAAHRALDRSFREGTAKIRAIPESTIGQMAEIDVSPAISFIEANEPLKHPKRIEPVDLLDPLDPQIMELDGALKLFVDYCNATAVSPQPFLALAAGLCFIGALAGRRYRSKTDLRTNIYALGIADSSGGKDHARKVIKALANTAGLQSYLGGEDIASGQAIATSLGIHPARLFQIDEFGDFLKDVLNPKTSGPRRAIAQRLKTLYGSASTYLAGTEYADQSRSGRPRDDIQQPHACLYGTTTPGQFWSAIESGSLHDGLLARILIFVSPVNYPDEREPEIFEPPSELVDALREISVGVSAGTMAEAMVSGVGCEPHLVSQSPEATQAITQMRRDQLDRQRKHEGTYVTAIVGRLTENAIKIALVRAISRHPLSPRIEINDVMWARKLVEHCIDNLLRDADRYASDNEHEKKINRIISIIRRKQPVSKREILRNWRGISGKELTEMLLRLIEDGTILVAENTQSQKGGKPTTTYRLSD